MKLTLCFGWVLLLIGACSPSEDEIQEEFDAYVAKRNSCTETPDCVLASAGCPLDCYAAVNAAYKADVEAKASELIADYESGGQACDYSCVMAVAVCTEGRCEVQPQ